MKATITATAPTTYQLQSLNHFGLEVKKHVNGSYTINQEFKTLREAKNHLIQRAELYFDDAKELAAAKRDIKKGYLQLDAVTATIN